MKVSIVIPAYNEEKYIAKTIEAALAQDYSDMEVIVVDNASTDATAQVAAAFSKVKVVFEPRRGSQFARERGRLEATGDIIACLDADCLPPKNWLSHAVAYFNDERVVAVSGPVDYFDAPRTFRVAAFLIQKTLFAAAHFVVHGLRISGIMQAGNMIIRSSALKQIGGYETSITFYGDDTDTAKRLMAIGGRIKYKANVAILTSSRRFGRLGVVRTFYLYLINFLWVTFFKKPYSQRWFKKKVKATRKI